MDTSEFYEFEDRAYVNPNLSSNEQQSFIDKLRETQGANTAQIQEQTYNLGTEVPSNLGGLGGGEAYFTSRYQTPQVDEMVSTLKTAAQAQALNDVMTNYQNQLQNQYKQAYRKYQARERARARARGSYANPTTNPTTNTTEGKVEVETGDTPLTYEGLSFRQWLKENGYPTYITPETYVKSGVPEKSLVAAQEALKKSQEEAAKKKQQQNSVFQPFYSGELVLNK